MLHFSGDGVGFPHRSEQRDDQPPTNDTMKTTAKKLTAAQSSLADLVTKNPGLNTHRLAVLRGDFQAYESQLKNRLRWLEKQGIVKSAKVGRETQWSAA